MENEIRQIINGWIAEEVPVSVRMSILSEHKESLVNRLKKAISEKLYSAYDDGFNDGFEESRKINNG